MNTNIFKETFRRTAEPPSFKSSLIRRPRDKQSRSSTENPDVVHGAYQVPAVENFCFLSIFAFLTQKKLSPLEIVLIRQVLEANSHCLGTLCETLEHILDSPAELRLLPRPQECSTLVSRAIKKPSREHGRRA